MICRDCPEWRSIASLYGTRMEQRDIGQCRHDRDGNDEVITAGDEGCLYDKLEEDNGASKNSFGS